MKHRIILSAFILFLLAFVPLKSFADANPDSTGLPGDNLSLRAVLDLFRRSNTLEDFEKQLNTKDNHINNLDLNGDAEVDYIRVVDMMKDKIHAIVLQVPVNAKESQDVAVIELELKGEKEAHIQIVGDEELYGDKYIVEPKQETKTDSLDGKWQKFSPQQVVWVNVWYWPCVQYVYYPTYIIWVSPWSWMYWPYWWAPWPPYPYFTYYGYVYYYEEYYYCTDEYRMTEVHTYYGPRRVASSTVHQRYEPAHEQYKEHKKEMGKNPKPAKPNYDGQPQPAPQPSPKPKVDGQPTPSHPTEQPRPQPAPTPTPRPHGDVHPAPQPKPDVKPAPQPTPRPKGRPRLTRKKSK